MNKRTSMASTCPTPQIFYHNSMAPISRTQSDLSSHVAINNLGNTSEQLNVQNQQLTNPDATRFANLDDSHIGRNQNLLESTLQSGSTPILQYLDSRMQPNVNNHETVPCSTSLLPPEKASKSEYSKQTKLKKERKNDAQNLGQKVCKCKKSRCLKLYCVCFAGGKLCDEACKCEDCFNKSSQEEMISSAKQKIKNRNPHAFSPEVVHDPEVIYANGEQIENASMCVTLLRGRHKTGCSCKKSKCHKKYCECYQAGVGCTLSCRCNDCGNIHHTKQAYAKMCRMSVGHIERNENVLKMGSSTPNSHILQTNNSNGYHVELQSTVTSQTPLSRGGEWHGFLPPLISTPSRAAHSTSGLLCGRSGDDAYIGIGMNGSRRFFIQQPDSFNAAPLPSPTVVALRNPASHSTNAGEGGTSMAIASYSTEGSDSMENLICQSSTSSDLFQSGVCLDSQHFSPRTPQASSSGSKFCNYAYEAPEEFNCAPSAVKTNSPNNKRVCPPQNLVHDTRTFPPSSSKFPSRTPDSNNLEDTEASEIIQKGTTGYDFGTAPWL